MVSTSPPPPSAEAFSSERLPPHNLDAEQSLLGSLLIDRDAIIRVASFVKPEDFYQPANGTIYKAVYDLYNKREPTDLITLSDELTRREQLDAVGGVAYLTALLNAVPTAVHVEYYGRIVERTATLRRLIDAGTAIVSIGFQDGLDTEDALDAAEKAVFAVSQKRQTKDFVSIAEVLDRFFDQIDHLQQHRGEVVGVATGFGDLDSLTGGLQRSDLIILAARPSMGKTSLALGMAYGAAVSHGKTVGIFSLEMSAEQLVQRLLAMETGIDSHRLRLGQIEDGEWDRISRAFGRLAEASIYIDDQAGASVMDVRSKARRLQAEHGLDFVVVDYLQLMSGRRSENRVQEISEISRGLKGLARELNVPVVALSQLSRAVESRADHRPMLSDLRESGCLTGDTLIYLPATGTRVPIRELVGRPGCDVLAVDPATWRLERRRVLRAFPTGCKPVFRLTTRLGRTLRATANHQFLTVSGWRRLDEMSTGARLAVPTRLVALDDQPSPPARHPHPGPRPQAGERGTTVGCRPTATVPVTVAADFRAPQGPSSRQPDGLSLGLGVADRPTIATPTERDVAWDDVISIEPAGVAEVFDLTVEGLHNFVANDIVVHNSIEQDADIVVFIYREDKYDEDSEKKGIAEIIVAKHRNGPVGTINLRFFDRTARFADLERYRDPGA